MCVVVNWSSNNITKLYPLPSSVLNNDSFIQLARKKISHLLCSGKTALELAIGGVLTRHLLYVHQYVLTCWYLSYPYRMITDNQNASPAVVKLFKHMVKYFPCTTRHTRFMRVEVLIKIVENSIYNSDYKQEYE